MVRIALACLVCVLFFAGQTGAEYYDAKERFSSEYAKDYAFHIGAGAVVGGLTYYFIPDDWGFSKLQKGLAAVGVPMVFKAIFEVFDDVFDERDILEYGAGALIPTLFFTFKF